MHRRIKNQNSRRQQKLVLSTDKICRKVDELIETYGTTDLTELCDALNIIVTTQDLDTDEDSIKWLVTRIDKFNMICIVLNNNLTEIPRKFYLAHEIGHAILHINDRNPRITDMGSFDITDKMEIEANLFAAELLLGDSETLDEEMRSGEYTMFQFAAEKGVPYELVAYKLDIMRDQGYDVPELPIPPEARFLSKVRGVYD